MLARLVPEPEPENIYDSGAIAVYIMSAESDSYDKVGYIARVHLLCSPLPQRPTLQSIC